MSLKPKDAIKLINDQLYPALKHERDRLETIDRWLRWDHDRPHAPKHATREYTELSKRAQTPWGDLIVTSCAQALYVDGYRSDDDAANARAWDWWQINDMDARQVPIHRAALGYGLAYATVLPGKDDLGERVPVIRGHSPRRMITMYDEPAHDDWPHFALQADPAKVNGNKGWALRLYDDQNIYFLNCESAGDNLTFIETREHNLGFCPVVRYANRMDLEGRTPGEIEPFIPILARLDQTTMDRLVVQRFASWVVRTVAGMAKPDSEEEAAAKRLLLKVEDLLVAEDPDTKFGSLPATPLDGFIEANKSDILVLAAVSQTPAHEMLGQMANLSAESLAAARASATAKTDERKMPFGGSHQQVLRASAWVMGDVDGGRDRKAKVRWRDTSIRSLAQAADALGKLAQMLMVPVEVLWEKIPGFDQQDVERARAIVQDGSSLVELTKLLTESADLGDAA